MEKRAERPNDETAKLVKAVLNSADGHRLPVRSFADSFRNIVGEAFPWMELDYSSASECLEAMSDVCTIEKLTVNTKNGPVEDLFVSMREEGKEGSGIQTRNARSAVVGAASTGDAVRPTACTDGGDEKLKSPLCALTFSTNENPHLDNP